MAARIEHVLHLRGREFVAVAGLLRLGPAIVPERGGGPQPVRIEANAVARMPRRGASVTEVHHDAIVGCAGLNEERRAQGAALVGDLDQLAAIGVELLGGGGADEGRVIPGELGDGPRHFLQPAVVGEAAVVNRGVGAENQFEARSGFAGGGHGAGLRRDRLRGQGGIGDQTVVNRTTPRGFEIAAAFVLRGPVALDDVHAAAQRGIAQHREYFGGGASAIQRLDQRLLQGDGSVISAAIAPGFEEVRFGQSPLADFRSFVFIKAEANAHARLDHAIFESPSRRAR